MVKKKVCVDDSDFAYLFECAQKQEDEKAEWFWPEEPTRRSEKIEISVGVSDTDALLLASRYGNEMLQIAVDIKLGRVENVPSPAELEGVVSRLLEEMFGRRPDVFVPTEKAAE